MAKHYELLSGEKIDLKSLKTRERKHISKIEKMIKDNEDYHQVYREYHKLWESNGYWTLKTMKKLESSPHYKIAYDLLLRYEKKCFSKVEGFEEYL